MVLCNTHSKRTDAKSFGSSSQNHHLLQTPEKSSEKQNKVLFLGCYPNYLGNTDLILYLNTNISNSTSEISVSTLLLNVYLASLSLFFREKRLFPHFQTSIILTHPKLGARIGCSEVLQNFLF